MLSKLGIVFFTSTYKNEIHIMKSGTEAWSKYLTCLYLMIYMAFPKIFILG
jgi:hypothetical protein